VVVHIPRRAPHPGRRRPPPARHELRRLPNSQALLLGAGASLGVGVPSASGVQEQLIVRLAAMLSRVPLSGTTRSKAEDPSSLIA
jgi:hypothetical protein